MLGPENKSLHMNIATRWMAGPPPRRFRLITKRKVSRAERGREKNTLRENEKEVVKWLRNSYFRGPYVRE